MFNKETINFLKSVNKMTDSIVLEYPITVGKTESSNIAYMFDLSKFDTDGFDQKIGLYELSNFLNVFNLFSDYDVNISNNIVSISDKTTNVKYLTSSIDIMNHFEFKKEQFDKCSAFPLVLEMKLTSLDLKKIKDASTIFKDLDTCFINCDEQTSISLGVFGSFNNSSNTFEIKKEEVSEKNFKIGISLEVINRIPNVEYDVKILYNEERNAYRIIFESEYITLLISNKTVK